MEIDSQSKPFIGVRFVLFGFDHINGRQVRSKLIDGGGVDVGLYSQSCTHVIVDRIVLEDPVCVAARTDGKTLVSSLWVDHSFDIGMPVNATSIIYKPPQDFNGIPGAKSLVVCLTGYQRQDREDIMTMVGLMGAQFSKPLVANRVTHLICYKFEGEKYELAKKIKTMKLVNHRWLEDSLRGWELLPESNYDKSGYELETLEAEAKDSEEEAEVATLKKFGGNDTSKSPNCLTIGIINSRAFPKSATEVPKMLVDSTVPEASSGIDNAIGMLLTPGKVSGSHQVLSFDNVNVPEVNGCECPGALSNVLHERTPNSMKVGVDLAFASKKTEISSHSGSKFSSMSYSRRTPRKSRVSTPLGRGCNDALNIISPKVENEESRTATNCGETLKRGAEAYHEDDSSAILPRKRMSDNPGTSSKSPKMIQNTKACNVGSQINHETLVPENKSSVFHSPDNHFSPGNNDHLTDEAANLNAALNTHASQTINSSSFNKKLLISELPSLKTVILDNLQGEVVERKSLETSFGRSKESTIASRAHTGDFSIRSACVVGEEGELQNQHYFDVSSAKNRLPDVDKSPRHVNMDSLLGGNDKMIAKPFRKKMVAKKSLILKNAANQKCFIYSKKIASSNDPAVCLSGGEERGNWEKVSTTNELEVTTSTASNEAAKEVNAGIVTKFGDGTVYKVETTDDETEAPDDKDEHEFGKALNENKSDMVEFTHEENTMVKRIPEVGHEANDSNVCRHDEVTAKEGLNTKQGTTNSCKTFVDESATEKGGFKRKINKGKRRSSGNTETAPADKETVESMAGTGNRNKIKEEVMEKEKNVLHPRSKSCCSTASANKFESSVEVEKENRTNADVGQTSNLGVGKSILQSMKLPMKINKNFEVVNFNSTPAGEVLNELKNEPVWFILSGHRLQRKEYQQVIRRLKGRFCRDSHQWSYQATHFIAPDPVRRTEKFFAAAASGRWILRTDYLSACSQAGKFLPEEPYEWHKNSLNEDGTINLEAPRKWRLFREKTGHGAFYGMRIIVYGDCIAPPLDTLKRVVKAADGNILATSPPYSRFLKSRIDFAVVSPGMPRVDMWVQEFLKHKMPCVVADYLVEFVCKPGYSLERHVLYNTHSWAEKSLANMLIKAEEIVADLTPPNDRDTGDTDDIICQVCGCSDRGEVMLICGTETGSVGCGVGTHIDCCDPPLENVPEEDWFCPKCTRSRINPPKIRKKGNTSRKIK